MKTGSPQHRNRVGPSTGHLLVACGLMCWNSAWAGSACVLAGDQCTWGFAVAVCHGRVSESACFEPARLHVETGGVRCSAHHGVYCASSDGSAGGQLCYAHTDAGKVPVSANTGCSSCLVSLLMGIRSYLLLVRCIRRGVILM